MLRCVTRVVERIVKVLVLACPAWFVHAVTDGDPCRVGMGPGGRSGEESLGCVVRVPRYGEGSRRCGGTMGLSMRRFVVVAGLCGGCGGVL